MLTNFDYIFMKHSVFCSVNHFRWRWRHKSCDFSKLIYVRMSIYIYIYNFYLKTRKGITVSLKLWSSCLTEGKKHITARKCFSVENIFGDPDILVFYWHGFREQRARHLRHRTCNQKLCYILGIWLQLPINQIRHSVKEKNIRQPYHILLKTRQSGERTK